MKRTTSFEESADKVPLKVIKSTFKVFRCDKQFPTSRRQTSPTLAFEFVSAKFEKPFQDAFKVLFLFVYSKL